jgi:hypothetical protein
MMTRRDLFLTAAAAVPAGAAEAPVPLGTLDRFWRYSPVLGPFHETGQGLLEIPPEMHGGDFPYPKRPFAQEVPFADHVSMVRLLGGFNDGSASGAPDQSVRDRDLAYRRPDGTIGYRMQLLRPRLQPYLDAGYDSFTFVLDNVPWCFPEKPAAIGLGQHAPPRDPREWRAFIEAVCRELVKILGADLAAKQRFRVGTENNGRERFDGTEEQFIRHYDHTVAAVRTVIPGAKIAPFNISGITVEGIASKHNVNAYALAEHCYREPNVADGRRPNPIEFVAYSRYFRPGDDPAWHARTCREVWEEFARRVPQMAGVSREIHEFGVAPWNEVAKGIVATAECGALGAALTAHMMLRLKEAGIHRLWHWGPFDSAIRTRKGQLMALPTGTVWLLSVLERMAGGDAYLFPVLDRSEGGSDYIALGSFRPQRNLLLVAAYHRDAAKREPAEVRLRVPKQLLGGEPRRVRHVRLGRDNAVHDRIRRDLAEARLLEETYVRNPHLVGTVRQMAASREGELAAAGRRDEYFAQWRRLLTLAPLEAGMGGIEADSGGYTVRLRMTAPEMLVLSW